MTDARPLVPFLEIAPDGEPYLRGLRCTHCRAVFFDRRVHCAGCAARNALVPERVGNRGRVHAYSIIYRSFPDVEVPYVSVVVDLDGGGTLKGNLVGTEPAPTALSAGMEVELAFAVVRQRDEHGNSYLGYHFVPRGTRP